MTQNKGSLNLKFFSEGTVPGKRYGKINHNFVIDKIIFEGKTDFQDILIFENSIYGKILVLDGIVQLSESDEFIYHEMITHPIMLCHTSPEKVLIIGGGDGGTLRETLKYDPEECIMVDIDKKVVEYCKEYLPFISNGAFDNPGAKVLFEDGKAFMKKYNNYFDVIIIDCNDPVGPSVELFTKEFYEDIKTALNDKGVCSFQMGSFLDMEFLQRMHDTLKEVYDYTVINRLTMPSYHCGEYCFMGAGKNFDLKNTSINDIEKRYDALKNSHTFKYYNTDIHKASALLPESMIIK